MMGVWDLSSSLGIPGQVDSSLVLEKIEMIISVAKAHDIDLGFLWIKPAEAKKWASLGIKFLPTVDSTLIAEQWEKVIIDIKE